MSFNSTNLMNLTKGKRIKSHKTSKNIWMSREYCSTSNVYCMLYYVNNYLRNQMFVADRSPKDRKFKMYILMLCLYRNPNKIRIFCKLF